MCTTMQYSVHSLHITLRKEASIEGIAYEGITEHLSVWLLAFEY